MKAIFCKNCKCIIYSRTTHDFNTCNCGKLSIDGGFDYCKITFENPKDFIEIEVNNNKMLEFIMSMDYRFGNSNANKWKDGYYGKFVIGVGSNKKFYESLIDNFKESGLGEYFEI